MNFKSRWMFVFLFSVGLLNACTSSVQRNNSQPNSNITKKSPLTETNKFPICSAPLVSDYDLLFSNAKVVDTKRSRLQSGAEIGSYKESASALKNEVQNFKEKHGIKACLVSRDSSVVQINSSKLVDIISNIDRNMEIIAEVENDQTKFILSLNSVLDDPINYKKSEILSCKDMKIEQNRIYDIIQVLKQDVENDVHSVGYTSLSTDSARQEVYSFSSKYTGIKCPKEYTNAGTFVSNSHADLDDIDMMIGR